MVGPASWAPRPPPCAILGNVDGFLVRAGDAADDLMDYDTSHLTANGSICLVSRFPNF